MNSINFIFGLLGSIASIVGLVMSVIKRENIRNKVLYIIIIILTATTVWSSYEYKKLTNEKLRVEERKLSMKNDAKKMYENTSISYWSPEESEGLILSLLLLLEDNKDIYPEMYDIYRNNVISRIEKADNENDMQKKREQMQIAGGSAKQILSLIAK